MQWPYLQVDEQQQHLVGAQLLRKAIRLAPEISALCQVGGLDQALRQVRRGDQVPLDAPRDVRDAAPAPAAVLGCSICELLLRAMLAPADRGH